MQVSQSGSVNSAVCLGARIDAAKNSVENVLINKKVSLVFSENKPLSSSEIGFLVRILKQIVRVLYSSDVNAVKQELKKLVEIKSASGSQENPELSEKIKELKQKLEEYEKKGIPLPQRRGWEKSMKAFQRVFKVSVGELPAEGSIRSGQVVNPHARVDAKPIVPQSDDLFKSDEEAGVEQKRLEEDKSLQSLLPPLRSPPPSMASKGSPTPTSSEKQALGSERSGNAESSRRTAAALLAGKGRLKQGGQASKPSETTVVRAPETVQDLLADALKSRRRFIVDTEGYDDSWDNEPVKGKAAPAVASADVEKNKPEGSKVQQKPPPPPPSMASKMPPPPPLPASSSKQPDPSRSKSSLKEDLEAAAKGFKKVDSEAEQKRRAEEIAKRAANPVVNAISAAIDEGLKKKKEDVEDNLSDKTKDDDW